MLCPITFPSIKTVFKQRVEHLSSYFNQKLLKTFYQEIAFSLMYCDIFTIDTFLADIFLTHKTAYRRIIELAEDMRDLY